MADIALHLAATAESGHSIGKIEAFGRCGEFPKGCTTFNGSAGYLQSAIYGKNGLPN
jgi:hypothetical protein